jgi:hypothetical protein
MCENNAESNFVTEKLWEPLLCECLCFYWGCPNVQDILDSKAYILLDMNDFEASYQLIQNSIVNNEWEKRIDSIRKEKQTILEKYTLFPILERMLSIDKSSLL